MPLDPQVRAFLAELASRGAPPTHTLTPQQARAATIVDPAIYGDPEPVASIQQRHFPVADGHLPARVYRPRAETPLPVFVYFHGGGWVLGDIADYDAICTAIANAGACVVVSIGYRLAPEHKYPVAAEDAFAATQWATAYADALGGDPRRVAVGGDSAGGNLATVACLMARDRAAPLPIRQVLIYPITNFSFDTASYRENGAGYMLTREDMKWFWRYYLADEQEGRQSYASPLRAEDLSDLPPALVLTAEYDPLRDEGEAYAARLREAGVPVTLRRYAGMIHGFFRRLCQFDQSRVAVAEVARALRMADAEQ
jgi:acetyl esterase